MPKPRESQRDKELSWKLKSAGETVTAKLRFGIVSSVSGWQLAIFQPGRNSRLLWLMKWSSTWDRFIHRKETHGIKLWCDEIRFKQLNQKKKKGWKETDIWKLDPVYVCVCKIPGMRFGNQIIHYLQRTSTSRRIINGIYSQGHLAAECLSFNWQKKNRPVEKTCLYSSLYTTENVLFWYRYLHVEHLIGGAYYAQF